MLVSASDPSLVIKLSEKESRTRSEISREASVCQKNACVPGTRPEASVLPAQSWGQRMAAVTVYPGKKKSFLSMHTWRLLDLRSYIQIHIGASTHQLVNIGGYHHSYHHTGESQWFTMLQFTHQSSAFAALHTHCCGKLIHHSHIKKIPPISVFARNPV